MLAAKCLFFSSQAREAKTQAWRGRQQRENGAFGETDRPKQEGAKLVKIGFARRREKVYKNIGERKITPWLFVLFYTPASLKRCPRSSRCALLPYSPTCDHAGSGFPSWAGALGRAIHAVTRRS